MPIVGLPMLPPGRRLRLRGLYAGKCLARVQDLSGGEERLPFSGRVIPDIFDPQDPYSTNQALAFFSSLSGYLGSAAGAGCSHTGRSDLERGIRQALDAREIVVISEAVEATLKYKVAPVAISRPRGTAWKVSGGADAFLIVRRKDLLPGERPMRDVEIREVIESLLSPGARPAAAEILGSLQGGSRDAASEKGAMRTRLAAAFRTGA